MSLEELRDDWNALEEKSTMNDAFTNDSINASLKSKYRSGMNRRLLLELMIMSVYIYFIGLIVFRFETLEKNYLEVLGIISVLFLGGLFVIRCIKLIGFYRSGYMDVSHTEVLQKLACQKISIQKYYLLHIIVGFFLMMFLVILNVKIYNEYDVTQSQYFWLITILGSLIFMIGVNKWIRNYYIKSIQEAEEILHELKN